MKKLLCKISIALLAIFAAVQYWPVVVHIGGAAPEEAFSIWMPLKDKRRLEWFFRDACFLNGWAYTLMGNKPMSTYQYRKPWAAVRYFVSHPELKGIVLDCCSPPQMRKVCHLLNPEQIKIKLGWETLNKYAHYFPNSRFSLCTYPPEKNETVVLTLIDKIALIQAVEENFDDFHVSLDEQAISPQDLLDDQKLYAFIKSLTHNGLQGTALGFGRNNAWLFHKHYEKRTTPWPLSSPWPEEEESHLDQLNQKALSFQPWDPSDLFYPLFACDPESEETKSLKQAYKAKREEIVTYYKGKDIVEATLTLLNRRIP